VNDLPPSWAAAAPYLFLAGACLTVLAAAIRARGSAPLLAAVVALVLCLGRGTARREIRLLLVWFAVCYTWFSLITIKEPRYVLLLVPPLVVLGAVGIREGLRALTGRFVSLYPLDDGVWLVVSMLQGWLWRLWRDSRSSQVAS